MESGNRMASGVGIGVYKASRAQGVVLAVSREGGRAKNRS